MAAKKILLAEDDIDDRMLFRDFLQGRNDIILMPIAENGMELMERLERIPDPEDLPHLIILDQNMPLKTGIETLQLLKLTDRYTKIPVVIYSTYADQQLINTCAFMGASAIVTKPVTKAGYHQMIDDFLQLM